MKIEAEQYYRPTAEELRQIAAVQTLAAWRHKNIGPPYTLSGSRVLYKGEDLIAWLNANRVETCKTPNMRPFSSQQGDQHDQ